MQKDCVLEISVWVVKALAMRMACGSCNNITLPFSLRYIEPRYELLFCRNYNKLYFIFKMIKSTTMIVTLQVLTKNIIYNILCTAETAALNKIRWFPSSYPIFT